MQQNLVSAVIAEEQVTEINTALETIRTNLPFLISLSPHDRQSLVKVGNSFKPFVERISEVLVQHPDIVPGVFDKVEYQKDLALASALSPIHENLKSLMESVEDTLIAIKSDSLQASLDIYASVQATKDLKPGMDVIYAELKKFFPRKRKAAVETT